MTALILIAAVAAMLAAVERYSERQSQARRSARVNTGVFENDEARGREPRAGRTGRTCRQGFYHSTVK